MSVDQATEPTLERLLRARWRQEMLVRWLNRLAPLLLTVFVAAAFLAPPHFGLGGRRLVISIAVAGFVVGVLGRNATAPRAKGPHIGFVVLLLASSVVLTWIQPAGPGPAGILLAVLCLARLMPARAATPFLVVAFVGVLIMAWGVGQGYLAVLAAIGGFYGVLFLAFRLVEANRRAEQLLVELDRSRAAEAEAAGLAERQRLAREMHDVLAHSLSGLILQLEGARMLAAEDPGDPRLPDAIDRAHRLGRTGLEEARRAIGMLRDDELPGPERLAGLAAQFEQDHDVPCRLVVTGEARPLGSEARLALYRVAQEALTNIARHADPARIELRLEYEAGRIRLIVEDFGNVGGERSANGEGGGYGLTGMRERAELLGGTLTAGPTGDGFRVELGVPHE